MREEKVKEATAKVAESIVGLTAEEAWRVLATVAQILPDISYENVKDLANKIISRRFR